MSASGKRPVAPSIDPHASGAVPYLGPAVNRTRGPKSVGPWLSGVVWWDRAGAVVNGPANAGRVGHAARAAQRGMCGVAYAATAWDAAQGRGYRRDRMRSPQKRRARSVESVVVGAGHSGLIVSRLLAQAGREHVVLDRRSTLGGGWQDRWDAFCLVSPNWTTSVPGFDYRRSDPDGFMA